jgi:hypothetical protein
MDFIFEKKRTPIKNKVDVVVVGGGPAGFGAAVAAARNGATTLLIERYGFLGGMLTAGLVRWMPIDKLIPLKAYGEVKPLLGGIVRELVERLVDLGGAIDPALAYQIEAGFEEFFPTDPEIDKVVLADMVKDAKAQILLHALAVDVLRDGNEMKGVIIESKSGREAVLADRIIDASGDADMAVAAGAEYSKSNDPLMMTLVGFMSNIDVDTAIEYTRPEAHRIFHSLVEKAINNGDLNISLKKRVTASVPALRLMAPLILDSKRIPANWHRRGEAGGWMESDYGDCSNVDDLTRAELKARATALPILNFFRKYIPGYENAYLAYTGTQIGVRESRRITGSYIITADKDLKGGLHHDDVIVKSRTGILGANRDISLYTPDVSPVWDIPYRSIVPKTIDGLLVAGRCISMDHKAATLISPRDIATCIAIGQAAGTAAALSIKENVLPRYLDIRVLQGTLKRQGANLG